MNCLVYLRVSTKEQAEEGYSIPAQREACLKFIQEKGWQFADEYADRGESARSADRLGLQQMLSRIKDDRSIDAIIVHKIDRLARNLEDHVAIRAVLRRQNVQLVSVVENIEDSASGRLIEGIHALMAEFYSANLAAEVKKGMLQVVKHGRWPSWAPVGYKNIREEAGGRMVAKIVPDPEKTHLIKEAFRLYAIGDYSLTELCSLLHRRGLKGKGTKKKPPAPIHKSLLARILQNKFYTGIITWDSMEFPGSHEPLVSRELFEQVQEVIRIHDQAGERKRKHPHYLRGTVFCGECGSRMSSDLAKGKYLYFYCLGRKLRNTCQQSYILVEDLEEAIESLYKGIQLPKEWVGRLTKEFENQIMEREFVSIKEKEFLTKKISKLTSEQYKLMQAFYDDAVPVNVLKSEQKRIADEIAIGNKRLEVLSARFDYSEKIMKLAMKMASCCYLAYTKARPKTRRMFNQTMFKKIFVKDRKIERVEYTEVFDHLFSTVARCNNCTEKQFLFSPSSDKLQVVGPVGFEPTTNGL